MAQEEKSLLLKDLCARLPYGVIVDIKYDKEHGSSDRLRICSEGSLKLNTDLIGLYVEEEIHLKPYLRQMSSMTEEELNECIGFPRTIKIPHIGNWYEFVIANPAFTDWLNAHHFDHRGLIPIGLALEAPEGMYKT